jgi:hypothetical protein
MAWSELSTQAEPDSHIHLSQLFGTNVKKARGMIMLQHANHAEESHGVGLPVQLTDAAASIHWAQHDGFRGQPDMLHT